MVIKYRPGAYNPEEYTSRYPPRPSIIRSREQQMSEHYVNALASVATTMALTVDEVKHYVNALASVATQMALTVDEVKHETAKDATLHNGGNEQMA